MNNQLIVFFGCDGSGKTTQARLLESYFKNHGFRVRIVWIRAHHSLSSVLSKILVRLGYFRFGISYGKTRKSLDINLLPRLKRIWGFIEFVSVIPWILIKVKLPLFFGYMVIAERYVVDTTISIAYFLENPEFLNGYIARILLAMISKNAFTIHLDAETEIIISRLERRGEEVDIDFVKFQRKYYIVYASLLGALQINNSKRNAKGVLEVILEEYNKNI